jgi:hypothetical protein
MKRKEMTAVVHNAIVSNDCQVSVEAMAAELDKAPSTLYNELNPFGTGPAKLGLDDAREIMRHIKCPDLADALAADLGYRLVRMSDTPNGKDMTDECLQGLHAAATFTDAANCGAHYTDLITLRQQVAKEMDDIIMRARERDCPEITSIRKAG